MRIYLSKSKQADPEAVAVVRKVLQENGHEIVEFQGGKYDPSLVANAEAVVAITHPQSPDESLKSKFFECGKGVGGEILTKHPNSFIVSDFTTKTFEALHVIGIEELGGDWARDYYDVEAAVDEPFSDFETAHRKTVGYCDESSDEDILPGAML